MKPRVVSAPTKVVVFQWPCGTPTLGLSPRGRRPWRRAMLVEAQVSSMNIRRSGSRSSWPSNHSSRRFRMSGRSCSAARAVFFARDLVALEEAANRAIAEDQTPIGQTTARFFQRHVGRLVQEPEDRRTMSLDPAGATVPAQRLRLRIALLAFELAPTVDARGADTEPLARLAMRQTVGDGGKDANPKIDGKSSRHACRPPSGGQFEAEPR
jgi:hypothetical protein